MSQTPEEILASKGLSEKDLTPEELGVYNALKKVTKQDFGPIEMYKFFSDQFDWASENLLNECYNNNAKKDMFFRAYARLCKKFMEKVDSFYAVKNSNKNQIINNIINK